LSINNFQMDIVMDALDHTTVARRLGLELGSRCRLTRLGAERCPRLAGQVGIVVGFSRANSSIRVLFDGNKTARSLHRSYIEPIPSDARAVELG
jgi:hypothetical protein